MLICFALLLFMMTTYPKHTVFFSPPCISIFSLFPILLHERSKKQNKTKQKNQTKTVWFDEQQVKNWTHFEEPTVSCGKQRGGRRNSFLEACSFFFSFLLFFFFLQCGSYWSHSSSPTAAAKDGGASVERGNGGERTLPPPSPQFSLC